MPRPPYIIAPLTVFAAALLAGCSYDTTQPAARQTSSTQPSSDALRAYGTSWNDVNMDVGGGSISNFDKNAMKRDMDSTLLLK